MVSKIMLNTTPTSHSYPTTSAFECIFFSTMTDFRVGGYTATSTYGNNNVICNITFNIISDLKYDKKRKMPILI